MVGGEGVRGSRPRSDGRWWGYYRDVRGRKRYVYAPTADERDRKLREALNQRDQGVAPSRDTVAAYVNRWLAGLARHPDRYAETTREVYTYSLGLLPDWLLRIRLAELTADDVDDALNDLLGRYASSTVARVRTLLAAIIRVQERRGVVARNVAVLSERVPVAERPVNHLALDEAHRLLAELVGHRLEAFYVVALTSGLRESELFGLRWDNVDLDAGTLTVVEQLTRTPSGKRVKRPPKSKAGRRTVGLPGPALEVLRRHRERQAFERRAAGPSWEDSGLVFARRTGGPVTHSMVGHALRGACDRAGVRRVSMHGLRHTTATFLLAQGVPSRVIMEVLGHVGPGMMARYQHVLPELRAEATAAMERALGGEQ